MIISRRSRQRPYGYRAHATLFAWLIGLTFLTAACDRPSLRSSAWRERPDSVGYRSITGIASACTNCIELSSMVILGADKGVGFLEDNGPFGSVVRDREGRYWVGQKNAVKVYAPNGEFVATVGRRGQGPLEFEFAEPIQVDASGMVHVIDLRLGRVTIVRPDFTRDSDHKIEGQFDRIAALPGDGNQYVIAKLIATPDRLGLPLHVVSGMDVLRSFGLTPRADTSAVTPAKSLRQIAVTPDGYVLSSMLDEYLVEAWTKGGARVAGFELPGLNSTVVRSGVLWSVDNPPPNVVGAIAAYDDRHAVVITHHRRPNWKDFVVERVTGNGTPYLTPADGNVPSIYRSRVDMLDLNTASVVASTWHEGYLLRMIERDVITRVDYNSDGAPTLAVLKLTFRVP